MFPPSECKNAALQKKQLKNLKERIPRLLEIFDLHCIVGEGSYGSVFLASLKSDAQFADDRKRFFAIKHLIPVSHPDRIEHELRCLKEIGGKDNVVGVDLCIRRDDAVVFVMPYLPHIKFSEYFQEMDLLEIKLYIKNLLIALNRVHQFNVIHRDVKPSNFLYDRVNRRYLLVDFGLAQKVYFRSSQVRVTLKKNEFRKPSNQRLPLNGIEVKKRKFSTIDEKNNEENKSKIMKSYNNVFFGQSSGPLVSFAKNIPKTTLMPVNHKTNGKHNVSMIKEQQQQRPRQNQQNSKADAIKRVYHERGGGASCRCAGLPSVCDACLGRQPYKASRSGTPGFRPPEVLLKYAEQTTAVDVWACGVILLCLLAQCYPFFNASDDLTALAEIVTLFGSANVKRIAAILGRDLLCSHWKRPISLRKLCAYLRHRNRAISEAAAKAAPLDDGCETINFGGSTPFEPYDQCSNSNDDPSEICDHCALPSAECVCLKAKDILLDGSAERRSWAGIPDDAFDLLEKLLDINPHTRIRAGDALKHSFLAGL